MQKIGTDEFLSAEKLEQLATSLAATHQQHSLKPNPELLERLEEKRGVLSGIYEELNAKVLKGEPIEPAEEWLVDNFHFVAEQLRTIATDLPRRYYLQLPALSLGPRKDYPRIYEMALQLLAYTDFRLDSGFIRRYIDAYQKISPLTTGELWAFAILLRMALIEHLTSFMIIAKERRHREKPADFNEENSILEIATRRVSVSNIILSLRLLAGLDWSEIVESASFVNRILEQDPAAVYSECDFATRDKYRHVVEEIARYSSISEIEVAKKALELAIGGKDQVDPRLKHVGYYLVDHGREELEKASGFHAPASFQIRRALKRRPLNLYGGALITVTLLISLSVLSYAGQHTSQPALSLLAFILTLLPASALAVHLVNWATTLLVTPEVLPKLELKHGIPADFRTIVVVPTILSHRSDIEEFISRLEIHYLANSDDQLDFAILSDYPDAKTETSPHDVILQEANEEIAALNERYPRSAGVRFHLFHRVRKWNPREDKWMGWERKRGKLEEFNRMLLGDTNTSFLPGAIPQGIQFVITLDSDTILPRDSARKLIATIAHPLNRPRVDTGKRLVVHGFGIVQPRISHTLTSATRTWFTALFSGRSGIDPYTTAVSDIYQDLFREASFIGKGIYDLRSFHEVLNRRFPENTLLSHDLIEGAYLKTALATDIELFDDHPADYVSWSRRHHRWVRGDWQVWPWLLRFVPEADGRMVPNPLSWLNRWKLLDNLRRSLVSPALFLLITLGWTIFPGTAWFWSLFVILVLFAPTLVQIIGALMSRSRKISLTDHVRGVLSEASFNALQGILQVCFLANEAYLHADAIIRTLFRIARKRKLLEWVTAAQEQRKRRDNVIAYIHHVFGSEILAAAAAMFLITIRPESFSIGSSFLWFWTLAPFVAWITAKEIPQVKREIPEQAIFRLRSYALDHWRFFDTFVREEDHWLPCDNFQEDPEPVIAHRTSPTNIGFALLANIAAYDFGYIGVTELVERTERTLASLTRLKTFNGHLYNWYDTRSLSPLEPRYVSTVDSGNLAASLIVVSQTSLQLIDGMESSTIRLNGIRDHIQRLLERIRMHDGANTREQIRLLSESIRFLNAASNDGIAVEDLLQWLDRALDKYSSLDSANQEVRYWLEATRRAIASHLSDFARPQDLGPRLRSIAREAEETVSGMDFRFLFDEERALFSIGFNVSSGRLDGSYYDLFASEARLASLIAIAKGDVPQSHWFRMSRLMTSDGRTLASWSGSVFEYLMPLLFLRNHPRTLLDQTCRNVVKSHRSYVRLRHMPWGMTEAAFNLRDAAKNYQYGPFGVPTLGLKHGLSKDLVVAPYASFLALVVDPAAAAKNLRYFEELGARGLYGFYEALDYTPERLPESSEFVIVKAFMAHHQGMSFIALDNLFHDYAIQNRFHADPSIQSSEILLQEKLPSVVRSGPVRIVDERPQLFRLAEPGVAREFHSPRITPPRTQLLSNGTYSLMISTTGAGYSERWGIRVNRWQEDMTCDTRGFFLYIRDCENGNFWSAGFQPACVPSASYRVAFAEDRVDFRRRDGEIETEMTVLVSSEENADIRQVMLVNTGSRPKELELTSYLEPVLESSTTDLAHPAFQKLFMETEFLPSNNVLLVSRRPKSSEEKRLWCAQGVVMDAQTSGDLQYETDRSKFLGRGGSVFRPQALHQPLMKTTGTVLDPILSLRHRIKIAPYSSARIAFVTLIADSKEEALAITAKYGNYLAVERSIELCSTHAQLLLQRLNITQEEAHLFQRIAGRLIFSYRSMRPRTAVLSRNVKTQSGLWPYGISGDLPICLVRIEDQEELDVVKQLIKAHHYWRMKGLVVDLVILNEFPTSYFQELQDELLRLIETGPDPTKLNQPGGYFLLKADQLPEEDKILLRTVARAQIVAQRGTLAQQVARAEPDDPLPARHVPSSLFPIQDAPLQVPEPRLVFDNGWGGFTEDRKEFRIRANKNEPTPAPWIHVICNDQFGFQISERGAGTTWSTNSRENRLTPWSNDPVSDPVDSALYIRDEESGDFWSVCPEPARGDGTYQVSYGAGYARFLYAGKGIEHELLAFVPSNQPVRIYKLTLNNRSRRTRKLSVIHYVDLVLGVSRSLSAPFVITSVDKETGALFAVNSYNNEFAGRTVFLWMNHKQRTVTGDRTGFLGPQGDPSNPDALHRAHLSGKVGAGLDPCAAVQGQINLNPLSQQTVIFLFGEADDPQQAQSLIQQYSQIDAIDHSFQSVTRKWEELLDQVQVQTPDESMNILLNRWLLYQALSCRFWSRSAFYQSSGAYGFRDQLQDAMAFVYCDPSLTRRHILLAASRQFLEGDVQHWWHPPSGRGVRTRSSDDLLWLPYCTAFYISKTGDSAILDETVPFLEGPVLLPDQMEAYFQPAISETERTLYEHCFRAIEHSFQFGPNGLPLIGSGDWNDGFNRMGIRGKGESVWLGWFLIRILKDFVPICEQRSDHERAQHYRDMVSRLREVHDSTAWDGQWYLRGFDDEGSPFGSHVNRECRIDSIAQSWAIFSGEADSMKAQTAMDSVEKLLMKTEQELVLLFDPPYEKTERDPGYIKGYPPGIRENGGQYNHAAAWLIAAYCELKQPEKAYRIFQWMNPIHRSSNRDKAQLYKCEPYAVVADVYSHPSYPGRGGWSWYTGSAAWLYRALLESMLGLKLKGDSFSLNPCIPRDWPGYEVRFKHRNSTYEIVVSGNGARIRSMSLNDRAVKGNEIPLADGTYRVVVEMEDDVAENPDTQLMEETW